MVCKINLVIRRVKQMFTVGNGRGFVLAQAYLMGVSYVSLPETLQLRKTAFGRFRGCICRTEVRVTGIYGYGRR